MRLPIIKHLVANDALDAAKIETAVDVLIELLIDCFIDLLIC